jgi:hypothetical protein
MSADGDRLVHHVLGRITKNLGARDVSTDRAAEQQVARSLGVAPAQVFDWRIDPALVPLDFRLALAVWLEAAGRRGNVAEFREMGRELRIATQRQRAAHMVEGSVLFADEPRETHTDRVMAYTEACCRRSPPPATPVVDEAMLAVMLEQLLARDEGHFDGEPPLDPELHHSKPIY